MLAHCTGEWGTLWVCHHHIKNFGTKIYKKPCTDSDGRRSHIPIRLELVALMFSNLMAYFAFN